MSIIKHATLGSSLLLLSAFAQSATVADCGNPAGVTKIHDIQGETKIINKDVSPLKNKIVTVEAIVTKTAQGKKLPNGKHSKEYKGFWIEEEVSDMDNNLYTSEGLFVYEYKRKVKVGDKVRLTGKVGEYRNVTQLSRIKSLVVCEHNQPLPPAARTNLPLGDLAYLEPAEGMRVASVGEHIVSDFFGTGYGFGNYGQFAISSSLNFQPTEVALPKSQKAKDIAENNRRDYLLIDDGVSKAYPEYIPFPNKSGYSTSNPIRIGDTVREVSGVLHAYKHNYMIIPDHIVIDTKPRPLEPQVADDANLVIVGMNVLNYFNGDGEGKGFPTSRGARSLDGFNMQTAKIVDALRIMNADVIGLMEIENDGFGATSAIQDLLNALNKTQTKANEYAFVKPSVNKIGSDEISVGLLYRPAKLKLMGKTVILDSANSPKNESGDALFVDTKNRPSLIQSFRFKGNTFTVSVNHLKSKGSKCGEPNERKDGQGSCNIMRTNAAKGLVKFLATKPTGVDSDNVLILGDLNAYSQEDPMQVFYKNGYKNLKYSKVASEKQPFSYSYSGQLGSLDHALISGKWSDNALSVDAWHINSVEAPLMDYMTEANGQKYRSKDNYAAPDAYRSSDHDPIVVGMNLKPKAAPGAGGLIWLLTLLPVLSVFRKR